jgi:hypothetical protein
MRYFITFSCYGARLHGDEQGSVDRRHNVPGNRVIEADAKRASAERQKMTQTPHLLEKEGRAAVLQALREVAEHRSSNLLAAHVRTTHVHAIIEADFRPRKS